MELVDVVDSKSTASDGVPVSSQATGTLKRKDIRILRVFLFGAQSLPEHTCNCLRLFFG